MKKGDLVRVSNDFSYFYGWEGRVCSVDNHDEHLIMRTYENGKKCLFKALGMELVLVKEADSEDL